MLCYAASCPASLYPCTPLLHKAWYASKARQDAAEWGMAAKNTAGVPQRTLTWTEDGLAVRHLEVADHIISTFQ